MAIENNDQRCPFSNNIHEKLQNHAEWQDIVNQSHDLQSESVTISAVQNLWHEKGYNGCIFSQVIANNADKYNWQKSVIGSVNEVGITEIDSTVVNAINNPEIRLLSLIFPSIKSPESLKQLCEILSTVSQTIFLLEDNYVDGLVALSFRAGLENGEVLAWIMGFGPYDFFPETRQAPYTELVIPVKKKPDNTYHRHNQDKSSAHVADQHIPLDVKVLDMIWVNTFKKTEKVLGHKPNIFSGARTTVTLPEQYWSKKTDSQSSINSDGYES